MRRVLWILGALVTLGIAACMGFAAIVVLVLVHATAQPAAPSQEKLEVLRRRVETAGVNDSSMANLEFELAVVSVRSIDWRPYRDGTFGRLLVAGMVMRLIVAVILSIGALGVMIGFERSRWLLFASAGGMVVLGLLESRLIAAEGSRLFADILRDFLVARDAIGTQIDYVAPWPGAHFDGDDDTLRASAWFIASTILWQVGVVFATIPLRGASPKSKQPRRNSS